jgi:hypothetical protein
MAEPKMFEEILKGEGDRRDKESGPNQVIKFFQRNEDVLTLHKFLIRMDSPSEMHSNNLF